MTDKPYPGVPPSSEATITYSMKEVIDQINRKLDLLPGIVSDMATMKVRADELRARVLVVETRIEEMEKHEDQALGAALFKDKFMAKLVGLATVMGIVAGFTVEVIQSF